MNNLTHEDAFNLLCGKLLGEGIHRKVFECRIRPDLVVKVEQEEDWRYFGNVFEMHFWNDYSECKDIKQWLAPCEYLSPDGRILLQKRCSPVPHDYKLPEKMPKFITDLKSANFGILEGNLVCVDYAMTIMDASAKLKKAEWY